MFDYQFWLERIISIAGAILSLYSKKLLFETKLQVVRQNITIQETAGKSEGKLVVNEQHESFELFIKVNSNDRREFIDVIICHEFYHLAFALLQKDFCTTDNTGAVTSIIRMDGDGDLYGEGLEELLCNYFAVLTVNKIFGTPIEDLLEVLFNEGHGGEYTYRLIEELVNLFSDEKFALNGAFDVDYESRMPKNFFVSSVMSGIPAVFITQIYDPYMGNGWWRYLCELFDEYYQNMSKQTAKSIREELKRYKKATTKECLE